ncbi:MAG TPA: hypothetical protein VMU25_00275 [Candidatus Paceibacterota bacterium]|nr:hypothetical protein [Candidatus Paceibacterota bacterium]
MDSQQQTPPVQPASQPQAKPDHKTVMGILAYLGILIIVPFLMAKDDPFVKFHIKQGLILVIAELVVWFIGAFMWQLWMFIPLLDLAILIFAIIGIVNVTQGKESELPLIGSIAHSFNF